MEAGFGTDEEGMSVWVTLTEQLTSMEVCWCQGHVPTVHRAAIPLRRGRQWWEPKDLLKASSYCKLAQRSLQSKKSLWFCIWHIYAPFLLETSLKDIWMDLNFQKEVSRNIDPPRYKRDKRKERSLKLHLRAESEHNGISCPWKRHKPTVTFKNPLLSNKYFNTSQLITVTNTEPPIITLTSMFYSLPALARSKRKGLYVNEKYRWLTSVSTGL